MCMQDIAIGQSTKCDEYYKAIDTTISQIVSASPNRFCLIISGSTTVSDIITLTTNPNGALGQGINLSVNNSPLILTIKDHGDLVRRSWYAIASAARTIGIFDCQFFKDNMNDVEKALKL